MSVRNVVKVLAVIEVFNYMKEITMERNPINVNVVKLLFITMPYNYTNQRILQRNPMNARNAGKSSVITNA